MDFYSKVRGLLHQSPWTFANKSVDFFPNLPQSPSGSRKADVIVLGSPVYYSYPTGVIRAFMERLMFPIGTYLYEYPEGEEDGKHRLAHYDIDLQNAYELGRRLVEKAKE